MSGAVREAMDAYFARSTDVGEPTIGLVHGGAIRFDGTSMDFWLKPGVTAESIGVKAIGADAAKPWASEAPRKNRGQS